MSQVLRYDLDDENRLVLIGKALSSKVRIDILKLLLEGPLNVNEIAERTGIPQSSAAANVKALEEAKLIKCELMPAVRGSMKVNYKAADEIDILISSALTKKENVETIEMPIGNFVDYHIEPTCGIVGEKGPIGDEDEPRCFFDPQRVNAKLMWLGNGYLEYRFPNAVLKDKKALGLRLSMEICSEDHEYNLECKSDITVWINGIEAGTFKCPSDFGGRRGKLNPDWWPDKNTQYGLLTTWSIDEAGTYVNDVKATSHTLEDFALGHGSSISMRLGIKENAENKGGINLFGDCFGDYPQNIRLSIYY